MTAPACGRCGHPDHEGRCDQIVGFPGIPSTRGACRCDAFLICPTCGATAVDGGQET